MISEKNTYERALWRLTGTKQGSKRSAQRKANVV